MNIQLSVVLWTVICFLLLLLILNNLLFRPVLKVLDERKRQLSVARQKKVDRERLIEEKKKQREALRAERERKMSADVQSAVEQIQAKEKNTLGEAHRECLLRLDAYREQREKELEDILCTVNPKMSRVAEMFAERVTSDKK